MFIRRLNRLQVVVLTVAIAVAGYANMHDPDHAVITDAPGMHGPSTTAGSAIVDGALKITGNRAPGTTAGAAILATVTAPATRGGSLS